METKSLRSKGPKKIKSGAGSGKQQLFVLPPDLLKELGITIGNPDRNGQAASDEQGLENIGNSFASSNGTHEAPDTSMLETASLMRKSVFLSPTFVSTATNVISGEVEIASKNNAESHNDLKIQQISGLTEIESGGVIPGDSIKTIKLGTDTNSMLEVCQETEASSNEYASVIQNYQDCLPMDSDTNKELDTDIGRNSEQNPKKLEDSYNNILHNSHSSNSNTDDEVIVNSKEISSISSFNTGSNKILPNFSRENILNEESIPLSKLKHLKTLQSSKINNLTKKSPTASVDSTQLMHSNLNVGTNISNLDIKDVNGDIKNTNFVTRAISPQTIQGTISRILDTPSSEIENIDMSKNNNSFEDLSIKECDRSLDLDSSNQNITRKYVLNCDEQPERVLSEDFKSSEYNINEVKCNGFDKLGDDIQAGTMETDQCSDEVSKVNNIGKQKSALKDNECNSNTKDDSFCSMNGTISSKKNISKRKLKQNPCSNSTSKQAFDSKAVVDNHSKARKSTVDNHTVINMTLKNKDKLLPSEELANILNTGKELSGRNINIEVDKVKEIAAYLKKFSHIYMDKKKIKNEHGNDIIQKIAINSNASTIKSKLCIQGVEKPGGKKIDTEHSDKCKVVKTYTRRNPKKSKLFVNMSYESSNAEGSDYELTNSTKLNTLNIVTPCEIQEFCLCSDFGRLTYYDNGNLYEHLHFWQHASVNCKPDLIFAIYNDGVIVNNYENELAQEDKSEENGDSYSHHVCWNIFQNDYTENVDNFIQEQKWYDQKNKAFVDESEDTSQIITTTSLASKENNNIILETCDEALKYSNTDIISETIDHVMVNNEQLLISDDSYKNIEIDSGVITSENSGNINTDLSTIEPSLTLTSAPISGSVEMSNASDKVFAEISGVTEQSLSDSQEITLKRSQNNESRSNGKKETKHVKLDSPKPTEKAASKRRLSVKQTLLPLKHTDDEPSCKKNIKCGLCNSLLSDMEWDNHVTQQHHLIAWRAGSSLNLEDPDLLSKLKKRLKTVGILICSICKMETRKLKKFIEHVKECIQSKVKVSKLSNTNKNSSKPTRKSRTIDESVTCDVCHTTLPSSGWIEHIGRNHSYLAWTSGEPALNLEDETVVWQHLQKIIRLNGSLTCYKCGFNRSRAKLYLEHIKTCDGSGTYMDETPASIDLDNTRELEDQYVKQPDEVTIVKCGVCKEDVDNLKWIEHIAREHNYMAWQEGDTPLNVDDEEAVWNHLQQFIRQNGGLICCKCGLNRRRVKLYLTHIETCDGTGSSVENSFSNISTDQGYEVPVELDDKKVVTCAVCSQEVAILEWMQHVGKEHNYLAWQQGCKPLNVDDESEMKLYLLSVSKQIGGLACSKCERIIKYPKVFMQHLTECNGTRVPLESKKKINTARRTSGSQEYYSNLKKNKVESVTCGVCASKVETGVWMDHLQKVHQYMAWIEGQTPLDLENEEMVQKHLYNISKTMGGLLCVKCGVRRKYVKTYQQHVEGCQGNVCGGELSMDVMKKDILECAVCYEKVEPKNWRKHSMDKHYNIAWVVGDVPIDLNNPYAVENYLKEYLRRHNKLVCKVCGITRISCVGFYAHIIKCGKTDEELEMYKSVCDICHNKYLRIYKSQHMTMHREQEYALERKLLVAKEKEMKKEEPVEVIQGGRRKAAERAKTVIEKYKSGFHDDTHYHCAKCGFSSEIEEELSNHVCIESKWGDASDSDESVKLECNSDDESDETDVDSNISDEEREALEQSSHKKRYSDSIVRMPYHVKSISAYMKKSTEDFIETYLTDEDLFKQWRICEYEEVLENELQNYMPPIEESCKVKFDENQDWMSFNRFESNKVKDMIVMFAGASIQCMSWVPMPKEAVQAPTQAHDQQQDPVEAQAQYLCVATHLSADVPRISWDHTLAARGLLQIWDCANLISGNPKVVLGIAHDYGTVWAIDWCPSGARDSFHFVPKENKMHRLGLLAAACSNGSAYIFLVPYPSSITDKDKLFYKLKPVAELRLVSNENRKVYQASAIKWSTQKGHSHVVVGYADGTTAYYDLHGESPILRKTENNMTIFYPYHDERVQNSCIEDVDIFPWEWCGARGGGAVCAGSAAGAGAGALQSHLAAARVLYPPHWPAALLAGDDCLVNQSINELEWWGGGRRLGGTRVAAGCAWCARLATATPPLLRLMRLHPCFSEVHKQVIGIIKMAPLGSKRKRQTDELAMIVEPITYNEAVNKYGIEFKRITTRDRSTQQKLSSMPRDAFPERFPLSDVAAMKFCPTFRHHQKLALALHAGLVFIINI